MSHLPQKYSENDRGGSWKKPQVTPYRNVSLPSYIGRHPYGGRRGGIRTSIPISDGQQLLQWLSSEVSLRVSHPTQ